MTSPNSSEDAVTDPSVELDHPVVLVVRDPDTSDDIRRYGLPANVEVIYLDLGSSFDIGHPGGWWERVEASEWVEVHLEQIQGLPPGHGARAHVEAVVAAVCERFGLESGGAIPEDAD